MNRKGFLSFPILLLVVAVIAIGAVVYFYPHTSNQSNQSPTPVIQITPTSTTSAQTTSSTSSTISTSTGTIHASTTMAIRPACKFSADPPNIQPPEESELTWSCENADTCSITSDQGGDFPDQNPQQGTLLVSPRIDTTYTLNCIGQGGTTVSNSAKLSLTADTGIEDNP